MTQKICQDTEKCHTLPEWAQAFSPDGTLLASAANIESDIKLWNVNLDDLLLRGCEWLAPYLQYSCHVSDEDRVMCDDILG